MGEYEQFDHPLQIKTPLEENAVVLDRFEGEEAMSTLFEFRLRLRSQQGVIDPGQLIGQPVTVSIDRTDGSMDRRYFHGLIARLENHGMIDGEYYLYTAIVRPWLWLLTQTTDCRIFQQQSSLDIAQTLFAEIGSFPFEIKAAQPPQRDYCVQYNESDFAFISRLLEDDGIFYYFRHENDKHTLVLGDSVSALRDSEEMDVSFKTNLNSGRFDDRLIAWSHGYELRPGKWAHTDYNFQTPDTKLLALGSAGSLPGQSKLEVFEYPGDHDKVDKGEKRAAVRADQTVFEQDCVRGQSVVETFSAGCRFQVNEHHSPTDQGQPFLLTMVHHEADQTGSFSDNREANENAPVYMNYFTAVPAESSVRPERRSTRPRIWGPQTAVVVGPPGEEIFTDKFGRIKVQFHWDRYGKNNDRSSCWVRVAFLSAGGSWGMVGIPRIGYEVVVEFIDGDPDRPLVTGCVYNARNMPPLSGAGNGSTPSDMPGAKTMTTLRSQSFGKTGGYNELTMNDTQGAETFYIKAQHNHILKVGHDRKDEVTNDVTTKIGNNNTLTIKNDHTANIGNNHKTTIQNDRTVTISGNDTLSVTRNRKMDVTGNSDENITGNLSESALQISVSGQVKLTLQCGASTIEMTPASISIKAPMVMIN